MQSRDAALDQEAAKPDERAGPRVGAIWGAVGAGAPALAHRTVAGSRLGSCETLKNVHCDSHAFLVTQSVGGAGAGRLIVNDAVQVVIAYEGDVRPRLRRDAQEHARSIAEALPYLYRRHGTALAEHLEGSFALAVFDRMTRTLLLAADHVASRPLFFASTNDTCVFGSHVEIVRGLSEGARELDVSALMSYFSFLYAPPTRTFFVGVEQVGPSEAVSLAPPRPPIRRQRPHIMMSEPSAVDVRDGLRQHVHNAVSRAVGSDTAPLFLLSSGVDSATLVAAARRTRADVQTMTLGFVDAEEVDERRHAAKIARFLGVSNEPYIVDDRSLECLPSVTRSLGAPVGNPAALIAWHLAAHVAGSHHTMVCGDGGNELFGGVVKYFQLMSRLGAGSGSRVVTRAHGMAQWMWRRIPSRRLKAAFRHAAHAYFKSIASRAVRVSTESSAAGFEDALRYYTALESIWDPGRIRAMLRPELRRIAGEVEPFEIFSGALRAPDTNDLVSRVAELRIDTFLAFNALPYVERTAAANGVEARFPYLDLELFEFVLSLPVDRNFGGGYRALMRAALGDLVPADTYSRDRGFNPPIDRWLRGALGRAMVDEHVGESAVARRGWFDPRQVRAVVDAFYAGRHDLPNGAFGRAQPLALSLWSLLALEAFCRTYA